MSEILRNILLIVLSGFVVTAVLSVIHAFIFTDANTIRDLD